MKIVQKLIWAIATLIGVGNVLAQTSGDLDLSTRFVGMSPTHVTVDSVAKWIENPLDQKLQIAVTNLYADTNAYMEILVGGQHVKFYGAGTDPFGNYIPTNYAPVIVNAVLRREYPMSIMCPNSGPDGSPLFKIGDLDPNNFLPALTNSPTDVVSAFLWSNFIADGQSALTNNSLSWADQQTDLTSEINHILSGPSIYNSTRFAGVTLGPDTQELLTNNPTGQQLVRLNHFLVRDAYASLFWIPTGNPDNSGTAEITFSVMPPPQLKIKKNQPAPDYTVLIKPDGGSGSIVNLQHPGEGNVSTNYCTVTVLKDKFGHFGLGDGCDDATKAPGQGSWLSMGPGCNQDTNRVSLEWHVSLGRTFDGLAAGVLTFREPGLTRDSYTPYAIYYNASLTNLYAQMALGSTNQPYVPTNYFASVVLVTTNVPLLLTNSAGEPYTNYDTVLRQVKAYQTFVDIVTPNTNQTVLNFYLASQVGTNQNQNGLYTNFLSSPFVTWTIQNPDPSTTTKLCITESRNGSLSTNSLVQSISAGGVTWTLTQGSGAATRIETREVAFQGSPATDRVETDTIKYAAASSPAYQCKETYHFFPWGSELVETRIPNNPDMVTSYSYYEDTNPSDDPDYYGYGNLKLITYADGYWEKRVYWDLCLDCGDGERVPLRMFHPYIDRNTGGATMPDDATPDNSSYDELTYPGIIWFPLIKPAQAMITYDHGARYKDNASGTWNESRTEGEVRVSVSGSSTIESANEWLGTATIDYVDGTPSGIAGHPETVFSGVQRLGYYYDHGIYDANSRQFIINSTNHLYGSDSITNRYPDHRETQIDANFNDFLFGPDGTATEQDGYGWLEDHYVGIILNVNTSRKHVRIFSGGNLAQTEDYTYTGGTLSDDGFTYNNPLWVLLTKVIYGYDTLGHLTNAVLIDGATSVSRTLYTADYRGGSSFDGELLLSETDENGQQKTYGYDALQRIQALTIIGYGSQPNQVLTSSYDVNGLRTAITNISGMLAQSQSWAFDLAGRQTSYIDQAGIVTQTTYSSDNRTLTNTLPGGIYTIQENSIDRLPLSTQGNGCIAKFYSHDTSQFFSEDPYREQTTTFGHLNSARWTRQGTDKWGNKDALFERPVGTGTTNTVWLQKYHVLQYDFVEVASDGMPYDSYGYNLYGQTSFKSQIGDGENRNTWKRQCTVEKDGAWYQAETNYVYLADGSDDTTMANIHLVQLNGFEATEIGRTIDYDADTNQTITVDYLDRSQNKVTQVTSRPASSILSATCIFQNGLLISCSTLSVNNPKLYFYDALGRTNQIRDSLGYSTFMTYDPIHGWLTSQTDAAGNTTSYGYFGVTEANAGKLKYILNPDGKATFYAYTARGELFHTWGDVPYPGEYHYDEYGELTNLITFRGGAGWSSSTWPTSPGAGDNTYWQYDDASGALRKKIDASGAYVSYVYQTNTGRLLACTWARTSAGNAVTATNGYNGFGDLVSQEYNDGTPNVYFNNFNRAGQAREIIDGAGTNELTYDFASRLVTTTCINGLLTGITVGNHFNPAYGRDVLMVSGISTPLTNTFGYDSYGRLGSVANGIYSATYGYLPNSDLLQTTTCKSNATTVLTTTRAWSYGFRLPAITNEVSGTVVTSHSYIYDALNRRTLATLEDGSYWQYGYNDRSELIEAQRHWSDFSLAAGQQFGYAYDNVGNRTSATFGGDAFGANLRTTSYTANNLNQYTAITTPCYKDIIGAALATNNVLVNGGTASRHGEYFRQEIATTNSTSCEWQQVAVVSGTFSNAGGMVLPKSSQMLTYDSDGNLSFDGVWNYQWDAENRLVSMNMTNVTGIANSNRLRLDFAYDYMNRRVQKIVSTWNGGAFSNSVTNKFVYDGWNLIVIVSGQSTVLQRFTWGHDLSGTMTKAGGVGGLLMADISGTNYFTTYDGNGNITGLIRALDNTVGARYEYSPYGELIRATGPVAQQNPFRFSTKFWDAESGFIYYGFRYYNPLNGKWMNCDPEGIKSGLNLYAFLKNHPTGKSDKDGRNAYETMAGVMYDDGQAIYDETVDQEEKSGAETAETAWEFSEDGIDTIRTAIEDNYGVDEELSPNGEWTYEGEVESPGSAELGGMALDGVFTNLKTLDAVADGILAYRNHEAPGAEGTQGRNSYDFIKDIANHDVAMADLDAITLATQVGATADQALISWGALDTLENAGL